MSRNLPAAAQQPFLALLIGQPDSRIETPPSTMESPTGATQGSPAGPIAEHHAYPEEVDDPTPTSGDADDEEGALVDTQPSLALLKYAVRTGSLAPLRALTSGTDLLEEARFDDDKNPRFAHAMARFGRAEMLAICARLGVDVLSARLHPNDSTPLHLSAQEGHLGCCRVICTVEGFVPDVRSKCGATALVLAALGGHDPVCKYLVGTGASVNGRTNGGLTPVMCASARGRSTTVALLAALGADVAAASSNGGSAMHMAAKNGHACSVKMLFRLGAAPDTFNWKHASAVYAAAAGGHFEAVRALALCGADLAAPTDAGEDPHDVAVYVEDRRRCYCYHNKYYYHHGLARMIDDIATHGGYKKYLAIDRLPFCTLRLLCDAHRATMGPGPADTRAREEQEKARGALSFVFGAWPVGGKKGPRHVAPFELFVTVLLYLVH